MVNLNGNDKARYVSGMFDKIAEHYEISLKMEEDKSLAEIKGFELY